MPRNKIRKSAAKKLLKKPKGPLLPVEIKAVDNPPIWLDRAYSNNRYVVMINDTAEIQGMKAVKVMIQRHDDKPIPNHWRELQNIKNEIYGPEAYGMEWYPPESELVDKANIYWLWMLGNKAAD